MILFFTTKKHDFNSVLELPPGLGGSEYLFFIENIYALLTPYNYI